jgi:hypothetical protein
MLWVARLAPWQTRSFSVHKRHNLGHQADRRIRHGRLDQLEKFRINGVQAISVEGQETDRLGRIAWMVWTGTLLIHVESDHGANPPPGRSHADLHEEPHGGKATPPRPE